MWNRCPRVPNHGRIFRRWWVRARWRFCGSHFPAPCPARPTFAARGRGMRKFHLPTCIYSIEAAGRTRSAHKRIFAKCFECRESRAAHSLHNTHARNGRGAAAGCCVEWKSLGEWLLRATNKFSFTRKSSERTARAKSILYRRQIARIPAMPCPAASRDDLARSCSLSPLSVRTSKGRWIHLLL